MSLFAIVLLMMASIAAPGSDEEPGVASVFTDYGGADRTACHEIRKIWASAPRAPKVKVSADGIIKREVYDAWIAAKKKQAEDLKLHFAKIVEMGKAFLGRYPGSKYEREMGLATVGGLYRTGAYEQTIVLADDFLRRYPALEAVCLQIMGDALDKLERYEEAANAYAWYFDVTTGRKAVTAGKKFIAALINSGQGSLAREKAAIVLRTAPAARRSIDAMLRPLALLGKPLPATPGIMPIFSEKPVDWSGSPGEVTLVLIWSNQYQEGEEALKAAVALARRLGEDVPFRIVGVALSENDGEAELDRYLNANELAAWPQILQRGRYTESPVLKAWGLAVGDECCKIPTTFLLDRAGIVRYADVPVGKHMETLIRAMR